MDGRRFRRYDFATKEEAEDAVFVLQQRAALARTDKLPLPAFAKLPLSKFKVREKAKVASIGAAAELLVCADLLRRGFDVYQAVSPNSDADIVIGYRGKLCRIECKSARVNEEKIRYGTRGLDKSKYDVLALVFLEQYVIQYRPDVKTWFREHQVGTDD